MKSGSIITKGERIVMKKVALVTYDPEMMCFSHVLLYAVDFMEKGYEVKVVIEGGAVKLVSAFLKAATGHTPPTTLE
jgi:hypothetical protein